jgi:hypothetical protein
VYPDQERYAGRELCAAGCRPFWLLLVFESGLPTRIVNDILIAWCSQLQEFFALNFGEWSAACNLKPELIAKLEQAKEKLAGQAFLAE